MGGRCPAGPLANIWRVKGQRGRDSRSTGGWTGMLQEKFSDGEPRDRIQDYFQGETPD